MKSGNGVYRPEFDELTQHHEVTWTHVGHPGHRVQERVDKLAIEAAHQKRSKKLLEALRVE